MASLSTSLSSPKQRPLRSVLILPCRSTSAGASLLRQEQSDGHGRERRTLIAGRWSVFLPALSCQLFINDVVVDDAQFIVSLLCGRVDRSGASLTRSITALRNHPRSSFSLLFRVKALGSAGTLSSLYSKSVRQSVSFYTCFVRKDERGKNPICHKSGTL